MHGDFVAPDPWSLDDRSYVAVEINNRTQTLKAHMLDMVSRRSTTYPVLDSSWISAIR